MKQILWGGLLLLIFSGCSQIGKKIGAQVSKEVVEDVAKNESKSVAKNILKNGEKEAAEQVTKEGIKSVSKTELKNAILGRTKDVGKYVEKTFTRILVKSKNQYVTAKDYVKWLSEPSHTIIKGEAKSGKVLRQNMFRVMTKKEKKYALNTLKNGNQAHHIIGEATPKAASQLKKYGIDINDPMNGIFLPSSSRSGLRGTVHRGGHTQDYYNYVEQLFSNCKSKDECYEVLDKIKGDLYNGKIRLYKDAHKVNRTFNTVKTA